MATLDWTLKFPKTIVLHLPRFSSDHSPILVRMDSRAGKVARNFRCENWWLECEGFDEVCKEAVQAGQGNWGQIKQLFRKWVRIWASQCSSPDSTLKKIESQMLALNQMPDNPQSKALEGKLQANHDRCLKLQEIFWHQRARLNWVIGGDRNSRFFHAMAVVRHRRNQIQSIQDGEGNWITGERGVRSAFITHFRSIYAGQECQ